MAKPTYYLFFVLFCYIIKPTNSVAQFYHYPGSSALILSGFKSDIGVGLKGGYSYFFNDRFGIEPQLYHEWGRPYTGLYTNTGVDANLDFSPLLFGNSVFFNLKIAGSINYEKFIGLATHKGGQLNYGGRFGAESELLLNNLVIGIYGMQGFMAKKTFGQKSYQIGLTLKTLLN